ncbi:Protein of unknown function [Cotesia congregata]|uniref:Uncharacterized protein n=1 Tax=Cotesia congregata TaxID=51543 RepID=A0A8J2MYA7_COTCN|nr:Protein of unknown function [Cotesia congregata]
MANQQWRGNDGGDDDDDDDDDGGCCCCCCCVVESTVGTSGFERISLRVALWTPCISFAITAIVFYEKRLENGVTELSYRRNSRGRARAARQVKRSNEPTDQSAHGAIAFLR